ncbi:hypothetical protein [Gemmata massiliana]|uniref:hypothetical protein n=1 Tax=Gemmata massiliana TaxID=1210884 RepID=UPI0013A6BD5C|nr:hypothetical protein [Gemmata massiliana]
MAVTGCNFVRFTRHGLQSIRAYWNKLGDKFEVRRQALKLRYWDERHEHGAGLLFDHTYESIKALAGLGIYELRLDDQIGGQSNIRVVFFDPPGSWVPLTMEEKPLRVIWVLEALPKRRNEWTTNDLTRFRASRLLIRKRFYT